MLPYVSSVFRSFGNKGLRLFAETGDPKKLGVENVGRVRRIRSQLEAATGPDDMNLPGYRFHELSGSRKGTYAVNASGNDRITVRRDAPDVVDVVDVEDYHRRAAIPCSPASHRPIRAKSCARTSCRP
ncbi:type II toxin-antitoxin system RelE/ParE family toxin [Methylobacterium platani]|uniref:type II toxin-antitoxin system RelE/ParE family toxin n=1 Tax=Methylobacterium platani TaxID=427683 RepID=UPI0007DC11F7|nr:hypothetical protein [Methylobacterium platani]